MRILANDFGQSHGYTLFDWESPKKYSLTSWQKFYGTDGHMQFKKDIATMVHGDAIFLGERFLFLHENRDRTKIDFTPAEYIGVAKLFCQERDIRNEWQNAAQACGATAFWGDDKNKNMSGGNAKIKMLGLWQPGKPHAMDSLRHLLYYFSFTLDNDFFIQQLR